MIEKKFSLISFIFKHLFKLNPKMCYQFLLFFFFLNIHFDQNKLIKENIDQFKMKFENIIKKKILINYFNLLSD